MQCRQVKRCVWMRTTRSLAKEGEFQWIPEYAPHAWREKGREGGREEGRPHDGKTKLLGVASKVQSARGESARLQIHTDPTQYCKQMEFLDTCCRTTLYICTLVCTWYI